MYHNSLPEEKIFKFGEEGSGFKSRQPQDFYKLRDFHYEKKTLFEDPQFPPNDKSLYYTKKSEKNIKWLRPGEIRKDPKFHVEGFSRFDSVQGEFGDCWLIAAVANLTLDERLFWKVVPKDQDFKEKYAGIFHFRFWVFGRWIDIVIDDRLPTYKGKLISMHSSEKEEFWSALLEKAYAKLYGSYEALEGGFTAEALEDFTGGIQEFYNLKQTESDLKFIIIDGLKKKSLMGCSINADENIKEAVTKDGLVRGHAYSITKATFTSKDNNKIALLRIRNPWGNKTEWKGAWSDGSNEWKSISKEDKKKLGLTFDDDGEFWMSYEDFVKKFDLLEMCNITPAVNDGKSGKMWKPAYFEGQWVKGVTAGGCINNKNTFANNPQYRITLTKPDVDDESGKCTVIVALMQKYKRRLKFKGEKESKIGFSIYHIQNEEKVTKPLNRSFFKTASAAGESPYIDLREISCRFKLNPGTYCIIPTTFHPNEDGDFLLRVYSEHNSNMQENDAHVDFVNDFTEIDSNNNKSNLSFEDVQNVFEEYSDNNIYVNWMKLKQILNELFKKIDKSTEFSNDVIRGLVALYDKNISGRLDLENVVKLWNDVLNWRLVFLKYDKDNSNTLSGFELREALYSAGYSLNNHVLNMLMHRYGNENSTIDFDDFAMCIIKLKHMIEVFRNKVENEKQAATFLFPEFIKHVVYS